MLRSMSGDGSDETWEPPLNRPVLPGEARTDYERYLNTEELLALQKGPDEWVHRDELLFQVVHQSSELWLKLAWNDTGAAAELVGEGDVPGALRLLRRASLCMRYVTAQLDMLEQMSPWEYQEIRKVLGHGSGFDSPGVKELRPAMARLGAAFHAARERAGLSLAELYVQGREHEDLYQLAEALMELDEWMQTWRIRHYRVVARVIGERVIGTQGTPVEVLGRLIHRVEYPELWDVRNELTALSKADGT
jgi:tryptophan 2,3-dioxygenase